MRAFSFLHQSAGRPATILSLAIVRGFVVSGGPMVGKEIVVTAASNVSASAEIAKVAPLVGAFAIGGLTPYEWAWVFAGLYSLLLCIHLVMGKWVFPVVRLILAKRAARAARAAADGGK